MSPLKEMSIDELWLLTAGYAGDFSAVPVSVTVERERRRAARDAILDLQEQLDRENLVLVPNFPTAHQVTVGLELHASYEGPGWQGLAMNLYRAMIDAAPLPSPSESKGG